MRAVDEGLGSQVGDIVLLNQLPTPHGHLITHKVMDILYKNGAIIDPITGLKCHSTYYESQALNEKCKQYTQSEKS